MHTGVEFYPQSQIHECFAAAESDQVDYCVVPYENSTNGLVVLTYDLIRDLYLPSLALKPSCLRIVAEQFVAINHFLLTRAPSMEKVTTIYSHPQVWTQVASFMNSRVLPSTKRIDTSSTAKAAEMVLQDTTNTSACISSVSSAQLYDLPILFENIQDNRNNTTRFLIFGKNPLPARAGGQTEGKNQASQKESKELATHDSTSQLTSLIVTLPHEPGALCDALCVFKECGLSLIAINSRPSHADQWHPVFFIELLGSFVSDESVKEALNKVQLLCHELVWLGSYENKHAHQGTRTII